MMGKKDAKEDPNSRYLQCSLNFSKYLRSITSGSPSKYSSNNHSQNQIDVIEEAIREHSFVKASNS